jgi:hypothetical protein
MTVVGAEFVLGVDAGDGVFVRLAGEIEEKRDFSLRRPTVLREQNGKKKSACSVRNDGGGVGNVEERGGTLHLKGRWWAQCGNELRV